MVRVPPRAFEEAGEPASSSRSAICRVWPITHLHQHARPRGRAATRSTCGRDSSSSWRSNLTPLPVPIGMGRDFLGNPMYHSPSASVVSERGVHAPGHRKPVRCRGLRRTRKKNYCGVAQRKRSPNCARRSRWLGRGVGPHSTRNPIAEGIDGGLFFRPQRAEPISATRSLGRRRRMAPAARGPPGPGGPRPVSPEELAGGGFVSRCGQYRPRSTPAGGPIALCGSPSGARFSAAMKFEYEMERTSATGRQMSVQAPVFLPPPARAQTPPARGRGGPATSWASHHGSLEIGRHT